MTLAESTLDNGESVERPSLAGAFWGWCVAGWLAYLILPALFFAILSRLLPEAVLVVFVPLVAVWVVGLAVYPFFALWKVWHAGRSAGVAARWFTRIILIAANFAFVIFLMTPSHGNGIFGRRLNDGAAMAAPARTAIDAACSMGSLKPNLSHENLGLDAPGEYANQYAKSVTVNVEGPSKTTVTLVLKEIRKPGPFGERRVIPEGAKVIYSARCDEGLTRWTVGGTLPKKQLARLQTALLKVTNRRTQDLLLPTEQIQRINVD